MHITFLIHSLKGGGAERVTCHMAEYWTSAGHNVTVVTIAPLEDNRYTLSSSIKLCSLDLEELSTGFFSGLKNNLDRIRSLRRTIRKLNPDIIIAMMVESNITAALSGIGLPHRTIGSERNYPGHDYTNATWNKLRKLTYRLLNVVVMQTHAGKSWMTEHTNARKIAVIPNPVVLPLPVQQPHIPTSKKNNKYMAIGVGRLTAQKQFDHLIRCFANVAHANQNWDLAILGEGELEGELKTQITSLGMQNRVHLLGRVGNISDWYESTDLFILTSATEGYPNALIESMAHGLPPISYDCLTGPSEIIDHDTNGVLIELNNEKSLTRQLEALMRDHAKRKALGQSAKDISKKLDSGAIMKQWDKLIAIKDKH